MSSSSISKGTILLYLKTLFNVLIAFYTTRLVLQNLGVVDFGIYSLIAGFVSLFSFLKASLASSTQRFISYTMGRIPDMDGLFSTNVIIHLIFSLIVVVLLFTIGLPFVKTLAIPEPKIATAYIVFIVVLCDTFITINSIPYDGLLNAKENFLLITVLGVIESALKLIAAVLLGVFESDRLVAYSLFLLFTSLIVRSIAALYCRNNYPESKVSFTNFKSNYAKEMTSFIGWNTFGAICSIFRNQGLAIVLNLFFGIVINASYAIANQINSQLSFFSQSLLMAIKPRLVMAEGAGDRNTMMNLSFIASKFSFYLLTFFSIPLIIKMPVILKVWLDSEDQNTIDFCRLIIILNMIIQLTVGISMSMQAVGKIKLYQIVVGLSIMLSVPIGYIIFMHGFPPISILYVAIYVELFASILRIIFASRTYKLKVSKYLAQTVFPPVLVFICSYYITIYVDNLIEIHGEIYQLVIVSGISTVIICSCILIFGLNNRERKILVGSAKQILNRLI